MKSKNCSLTQKRKLCSLFSKKPEQTASVGPLLTTLVSQYFLVRGFHNCGSADPGDLKQCGSRPGDIQESETHFSAFTLSLQHLCPPLLCMVHPLRPHYCGILKVTWSSTNDHASSKGAEIPLLSAVATLEDTEGQHFKETIFFSFSLVDSPLLSNQ